jgi:hypothetical protein
MVVNCGVWVDVMASSQDEADAAAIDWIYDEKNAAEREEREYCAHGEWEVDNLTGVSIAELKPSTLESFQPC